MKLRSVIQTCCVAALYGCCKARLLLSSPTWQQCCRVAAIENHLAPALQDFGAAGLLGCQGAGLLCCRAAGQCGCFNAGLLSHRATLVARAAVVALCCRAAVCSAAALQGRCTAALLHCRSGVQQCSGRACMARMTHLRRQKSKLFRIIEFTFAFTSLSFACAGVLKRFMFIASERYLLKNVTYAA